MKQTRQMRVMPFEQVRMEETGDGYTFSGYAAVYDKPYPVTDWLGSYTETFKRGSFKRTVGIGDDVRLLVNHDGIPMARTKSGTLQLDADDPYGLKVTANLDPASPQVQTIRSAMDRGDLDQMSHSFTAKGQEWRNAKSERDVTEAQLFDVSVVTFPANDATSAAMRFADTPDTARVETWMAECIAELRAGKVLSSANVDLLSSVLDVLNRSHGDLSDAADDLGGLIDTATNAPGEPDGDEPRSVTAAQVLLLATRYRAAVPA